MCYDIDENTGDFTYMLGRGIDNPEDLANIQPDMKRIDIVGGLYAIFPTPPADGSYIKAAQDTWNEIFLNWLPQSEFEFDETRQDFEYHDYRDHGWYFGGKLQIDICIPIRQREEEMRKSQMRTNRIP
jgi:AraC family transcriptional regulator